jgi:ADP-heptose:LPS heptosyltransferase
LSPEPPRLLVLRALGVGDLLTAVPSLVALARAFPRHRRQLAAPCALAPLLELLPGGFTLVPTEPLARLSSSLARPAVGVNLHGRGPESSRVLLDARPRRLLSFFHPEVAETEGMPRWRPGEHEVERWCRVLHELGVPAHPRQLDIHRPSGVAPRGADGATVIHPGAASPARRWPAERFSVVARAERLHGRRVVVTGSPDEVSLAREVAAQAGLEDEMVLAGQTDLAALARVVAAAGRVVCGDTGIAHLATALGTPSVVLFGPTSPLEWGPPADRPRHRVLWSGTTGDPHGAEPDPGLLEVGPATVIEALARLPAGERLVSGKLPPTWGRWC